jgi:hypothetical protein
LTEKIFSVLSYFGTTVVLTLVKEFGSVVCVMVTSSRKMVTVVFSFILFPKPFSWMHFVSGTIFFAAIFMSSYLGNPKEFNEQWNQFKALLAVRLRFRQPVPPPPPEDKKTPAEKV